MKKLNSKAKLDQLLAAIGDGDGWGNDDEIQFLRDTANVMLTLMPGAACSKVLSHPIVEDIVTRTKDLGYWESCQKCGARVDQEDRDAYYSSPCGTFCEGCMDSHMKRCAVCRDEFA